MKKKRENIKRYSIIGIPLLIAAVLVSLGMVAFIAESKRASEEHAFHILLKESRRTADQRPDQNLLQMAHKWKDLEPSQNSEVSQKSSYNRGVLSLMHFREQPDLASYLEARNGFREALRKNPRYFPAKRNLAYLESLARENGIKPEELPNIPSGLNNSPSTIAPKVANGIGQEKTPEKIETETALKNKIIGGTAPALGGEPPPDIFENPQNEELEKRPSKDY